MNIEELMKICLLARENLREGIEGIGDVESRDGAPAAEIIYQDEEVIIAWPARRVVPRDWEYTIDPIPPGIEYVEYRESILFLFPNRGIDVLDITSVPQGMRYFPSEESWLETMTWLMEKAGFSGPKHALRAMLLFLDNDLAIDL